MAEHWTDDPLYHVTYVANLDGISALGVVPGAGDSIGGSPLQAHKLGRIFLTEPDGVGYWYERAENWAEHRSDDPAGDGLIPVVLRVRAPDDDDIEEDHIGTEDAGADAYFCPCSIAPEDVEIWDGLGWSRIGDDLDVFDFSVAVDSDGVFKMDNPLIPDLD